jgi:ABC-type amino acid transport/signal transduction systems, periplasmic component/domain
MKKSIAIIISAVVFMGTLVGCNRADVTVTTTGESTEVQGETNLDVEGKKEGDRLIVGFDASFPPYGYRDDNGEYVGFDLSLAEEVSMRNGWELVKQPIDWDAKDMEINSGSIDCIWNGFTINGREDAYTWSRPYVDNSQVIVVSEDSGIKSLADLAGKIVEVQADSSALTALEDKDGQAELAATFAALNQVPDYNTAFMNLEAGAADAVAMDIGVAEYQIKQRNGGYIILDEFIATEQYGIGFKLGNEVLRDQIEVTLIEMYKDGTFLQIAQDWGLTSSLAFEIEE